MDSYSEKETLAAACELGAKACPGEIYCLEGDLGAGKTVFARGFAEGLGITSPVTSPTFTIVHEYRQGRLPLYHFDVYRIEDPEEMYEIGYEDYFFGDGVTLIEWPSRIRELIPDDAVHIWFNRDPDKGTDYRRIEIQRRQKENSGR